MATIRAGDLNRRVKLQRPTYTQNTTTGEQVLTWVDVDTVSAKIAPLSVREFIAAQAMQSNISTRIEIRYRDDVIASWRAVHMVNGVPGKVYDIHGPLPDAETGYDHINLACSTGSNPSGE